MNRRLFSVIVLLMVFAMVGALVWVSNQLGTIQKSVVRPQPAKPTELSPSRSQEEPPLPTGPTASELLLEGYGDEAVPPLEDLRKIHRVATGYFSVVKESSRFPIGGNADFSAALRGENANREVFIRPGHPVFSPDGLILDRWKSPVIVHPEAWRQLELRSAGPDRVPYTADDVVLSSTGIVKPSE